MLPVISRKKTINCSFNYSKIMCDKIGGTSGSEDDGNHSNGPDTVEDIRQYLADKLKIVTDPTVDRSNQVLETINFDGLIKHWKNGGFKNIITMVGAGISTSAGIPDFRSPSSGLYDNLQKFKLLYPTAIFQIDYFRRYPKPFFSLAKELYPGAFKPTPTHYFIKMLSDKGLLVRNYTQNIDTLERMAGIPDEKLVEAHGTFFTNHCLYCNKEYSMEWMKNQLFIPTDSDCQECGKPYNCNCDQKEMKDEMEDEFKEIPLPDLPEHVPKCEICDGIVKPDIVFFGENLPEKFYRLPRKDFKNCDLLIIMGTSLEVQPFASLIENVNNRCVRLLINREPVGNGINPLKSHLFSEGLLFDSPNNIRDVAWFGDCDDGVFKLAEELGFKEDLDKLIAEGNGNNEVNQAQLGTEAKLNTDAINN